MIPFAFFSVDLVTSRRKSSLQAGISDNSLTCANLVLIYKGDGRDGERERERERGKCQATIGSDPSTAMVSS